MAIPIALGIGWWATRTGRIGWAVGPIAGAAGGLIFSLVFFVIENEFLDPSFLPVTLSFSGVAAIYGVVGWIFLRWLRADAFRQAI